MKDKTVNISITIKESLLDKIKSLAESDRRSASAMISILAEEALTARGVE